ncbi:MAG: HlyC/CorC family transporter [Methylocystaceae bacterium]|nr:HlyC/CorC family transporter [Methylocystaceae bacterium]
MTLLILYLLLAIGVSFLCSVSEAVLLSTRPSYIAAMDQKRKTAQILKKLTNNLDRPLAAILTANTIAHTVGAAGVGAQASIVFGNQYLGIVSAILTFMILVFSEIIPKTLGAVYWKELAPLFGRFIHYMIIVLFPFVWCSQKLTNLISRSPNSAFTYTRDEVKAMIDIGKEEGVLDKKEHTIVTNMMKLHKLSVRDIMTPRTVIFSLQENLTVQDFFTSYAKIAFSRIPIFSKNQDDITGYVLKTDLLIAQAKDNFDHQLHQYKRDFLVLSDNINASSAYNHLTYEKAHISLIIDEYGSVQGVVTLEDIVETLIGLEIMDEMDTVEDMQLLARKRWRERMTEMGIQFTE